MSQPIPSDTTTAAFQSKQAALSLCSSAHWWPSTKCDSRAKADCVPRAKLKRRHWQRWGCAMSTGALAGRMPEGRSWHGRADGWGVMDVSVSGPQRGVTFTGHRQCQLLAVLPPAQAGRAPAHQDTAEGACSRAGGHCLGGGGGGCLQPLPAGPAGSPAALLLHETRAKQQHLLPTL